ncbi:hypothetical protein SALBM311S_04987 [Streptomyces alboniger]
MTELLPDDRGVSTKYLGYFNAKAACRHADQHATGRDEGMIRAVSSGNGMMIYTLQQIADALRATRRWPQTAGGGELQREEIAEQYGVSATPVRRSRRRRSTRRTGAGDGDHPLARDVGCQPQTISVRKVTLWSVMFEQPAMPWSGMLLCSQPSQSTVPSAPADAGWAGTAERGDGQGQRRDRGGQAGGENALPAVHWCPREVAVCVADLSEGHGGGRVNLRLVRVA